MTHYWKQEPEFKLEKCRSLASFQKDSRTSNLAYASSARPKMQAIRPKKTEIISENTQNNYESLRMMGRVKSVDQLTKIKQTISFENMLEVYKKENENLKQQNKFLVKEVKKKQKNQQVLSSYIQQLRKQIKKLQRNTSTSPLTPRSRIYNDFNSVRISKAETQKNNLGETGYSRGSKTLDEGETWSTMHQIEQLNERFNILMDQCSKQTCKQTRIILRGKLAETAQRMKNFKKQFNMIQ